VTDPTPPRRRALCDEASLVDLERRAERVGRGGDGEPWPAGWRVVRDRPSRLVVRAVLKSDAGPVACYVKLRRRVREFDAARDRIRRPRGPAEGRVLERLAAAGMDVPRVVCWSGDPARAIDLLATEEVRGTDVAAFLASSPSRRERTRAAAAVGRMLAAAHHAGLDDRDLHRGNVLLDGDRAIRLDAGTRPPRGPLSVRARARVLGRALHGLAPSATDALRALRAFVGTRAWVEGRSSDVPALARAAERHARAVARAYRAGRARRATRTGRHFETSESFGAMFVRRIETTTPEVGATLHAFAAAPPDSARSLKADGSVFVANGPGLFGDVVVKRFVGRRRDHLRVPRAIRAFRRAYALRIRGVRVPAGVAALALRGEAGVCASELLGTAGAPAANLHRWAHDATEGPALIRSLPPRERRDALVALGRFLRRMHDADVCHRDLKAPNLVAWREGGRTTIAVVDLDGARVARRDVGWRRRARDLGRLEASVASGAVGVTDRLRVLAGYFAPRRRLGVDRRRFADRVRAAARRKRRSTGAAR